MCYMCRQVDGLRSSRHIAGAAEEVEYRCGVNKTENNDGNSVRRKRLVYI